MIRTKYPHYLCQHHSLKGRMPARYIGRSAVCIDCTDCIECTWLFQYIRRGGVGGDSCLQRGVLPILQVPSYVRFTRGGAEALCHRDSVYSAIDWVDCNLDMC